MDCVYEEINTEELDKVYLSILSRRLLLSIPEDEYILKRYLSDTLKLMATCPVDDKHKDRLNRANDFMFELQLELNERMLECNEKLKKIDSQTQTD